MDSSVGFVTLKSWDCWFACSLAHLFYTPV